MPVPTLRESYLIPMSTRTLTEAFRTKYIISKLTRLLLETSNMRYIISSESKTVLIESSKTMHIMPSKSTSNSLKTTTVDYVMYSKVTEIPVKSYEADNAIPSKSKTRPMERSKAYNITYSKLIAIPVESSIEDYLIHSKSLEIIKNLPSTNYLRTTVLHNKTMYSSSVKTTSSFTGNRNGLTSTYILEERTASKGILIKRRRRIIRLSIFIAAGVPLALLVLYLIWISVR